MAKAVYEERSFTNSRGEIVKFPWYGVQADVNGEYMELPLKNLDSAEKVAFRMICTGTAPAVYQVGARTADEEEQANFLQHQKNPGVIDLEDEDDQ